MFGDENLISKFKYIFLTLVIVIPLIFLFVIQSKLVFIETPKIDDQDDKLVLFIDSLINSSGNLQKILINSNFVSEKIRNKSIHMNNADFIKTAKYLSLFSNCYHFQTVNNGLIYIERDVGDGKRERYYQIIQNNEHLTKCNFIFQQSKKDTTWQLTSYYASYY